MADVEEGAARCFTRREVGDDVEQISWELHGCAARNGRDAEHSPLQLDPLLGLARRIDGGQRAGHGDQPTTIDGLPI